MSMDGRFTDEELAIAKSVDLCAVAESLGYTVKRIGKYHTLKEMDSIRIYNRSHWYRSVSYTHLFQVLHHAEPVRHQLMS